MEVRILSADDVRRALSMGAAVEGMKRAFAMLSAGQAVVPLRSHIDLPEHGGTALFMPAFAPDASGETPGTLAVKTVSVFGGNAARGLPTIHASVQLLDAETGRLLALLEGATITAIRTGAASGAATDLLARQDAKTAAIFGSGVQARTQLEAVCTVRNIESVKVYSPNRQHAQQFCEETAGQGPIPAAVAVAESPKAAVDGADIICTATTSATPVFNGRDLSPGAHVNAVGSYQPHVQEIDAETILRSRLVVDAREAALTEPGDLLIPIKNGSITPEHIYAELGEIVAGAKPGRDAPSQITCFKSCGVAIQDAVAAQIAYAEAQRRNLGATVTM